MQPMCWVQRCPGDFLFWKMNTKQIYWDLSLSCCSEPGIPEEKMNSYQKHPFNRTFTTLLALLRCGNCSSWSWTGESVHLELGRRPLKRLMVHLVKFLHLKVPKYSGNVNKRKFEGVLSLCPCVYLWTLPVLQGRTNQITPAEELWHLQHWRFCKPREVNSSEHLTIPKLKTLFNPSFCHLSHFWVTFLVLAVFLYLFQDWHFCVQSPDLEHRNPTVNREKWE